jgi:hypothetical protein
VLFFSEAASAQHSSVDANELLQLLRLNTGTEGEELLISHTSLSDTILFLNVLVLYEIILHCRAIEEGE